MQLNVQIETGSGAFVPGLIRTMSRVHLSQIETIWKGMVVAAQEPDKSWDWAYKLRISQNDPRFEAYVVEIDRLTQGVVLIETLWHRSQIDGLERRPLVYVEFLASAPWNRRYIEDPPYFVGVGRALLMFTRERSAQLGYGGRVGLHSVPESEAFYHRQGMPDYGHDPDKDGLIYFEYGSL